uniref:non-specific serine/threonine protein kinase n=1 Tax=Monopterus albus TaxID=43700 RepID=A0A3Q3ISS9_MONAL
MSAYLITHLSLYFLLFSQAFELVTGDSLFHPKGSEAVSFEEDHIAQIIQLLGKIPSAIAFSGKYSAQYFNRRGKSPTLLSNLCNTVCFHSGDLRRVGLLRFWSLYDVLVEKYHFLLEEAFVFSDFLLHMLDYYPDRRSTAAQCLHHPWLSS